MWSLELAVSEMAEKLKSRMAQVKLLATTAGPQFTEALKAVETSQKGSVVSIKVRLSRDQADALLKAVDSEQ